MNSYELKYTMIKDIIIIKNTCIKCNHIFERNKHIHI